MTEKLKPVDTRPGKLNDANPQADDGVVNDSLGTIDIADSTGSDESKETGDAKKRNKNTRED